MSARGSNLDSKPDPKGLRQRDSQVAVSKFRVAETGVTASGGLQFTFAICMIFEVVLAMILGGWLGGVAARHFTGVWHAVVFWIVSIVGTTVGWCAFLVGFGCLFNFVRCDPAPAIRYETDRPHIS